DGTVALHETVHATIERGDVVLRTYGGHLATVALVTIPATADIPSTVVGYRFPWSLPQREQRFS
ncbi:MAG: hypothetical protein LBE07_04875, partial [Gordonia sp. (in: high G+C Gram-positive bacteria)]|nr:hypothetical protein [Gordonia sp. (in: high G+C Gram-positive bacteria)]